MTTKTVRKNAELLKYLRAVALGAGVAWLLSRMGFTPVGAGFGLAFLAGVMAVMSPSIGVLAAVLLLSLPVLASDFLAGAIFLVVGLASIQYIGQDKGRVFMLILLAFVGVALGPVWAAAVIAGYLLGPSEGAVVAALACLAVEIAGILLGKPNLGLVVTGSSVPWVSFDSMPESLITFGWVGEATSEIEPGRALDTVKGIGSYWMLAVQPLVWGLAATAAGFVRRPLTDPKRAPFGLLAAVAGTAAAALGTIIAYGALADSFPQGAELARAFGTSLAVALGFVAAWQWIFPPQVKVTQQHSQLAAEDADVDELLRLIATAEDELASKHTVEAVVMITDMKSFSKMTEEEGSVVSAKNIQRHRDLLLPVIAAHNGKGKSTGGDGLVAAFDSEKDALDAAVAMQRKLAEYNLSHPSERDIIVRIGVASGEVVLDKGGRPFIGNALNIAARVMNLGDGGQIFTTRHVLAAANKSTTGIFFHDHGEFELKNIAGATEVLEVLWAEEQTPSVPRVQGE